MSSVTTHDACGKIVLFGEYGVLFGKTAYAAGINKRATCTFTPDKNMFFLSKTSSIAPIKDEQLFLCALKAAKQLKIEVKSGQYLIDSTAFFDEKNGNKLGLGSSSAALVCLCKSILHHALGSIDKKKLLELAMLANHFLSDHKGSGLDIAASCFGGVIKFKNSASQISITYEKEDTIPMLWPYLHVVHLKKSCPTKNAVNQFLNHPQINSEQIQALLNENERLADSLFKDKPLTFDELAKVIAKIDGNLNKMDQICSLNIITPEHKQLCEVAKKLGGAAKISGAGGGDISLAAIPYLHTELFKKEVLNLNFTIIHLKIFKNHMVNL